ncbi:MAG TPA: glycosyltransferase family 4 protein [Candidatus Limnocylindrales bacterium]
MPRIAYLSYSTAEFDARTRRMARTALKAGFDVTVYARWKEGLPLEEERSGYRLVRVPTVSILAIPWLRSRGERELAALRRRIDRDAARPTVSPEAVGPTPRAAHEAGSMDNGTRRDRLRWVPSILRGTPAGRPIRASKPHLRRLYRFIRRVAIRPLLIFPITPLAWGVALEDAAGPADIWHGMWAGSLPALDRLRRRHGGRTIYDSRDVYMRSRGFERMRILRMPLAWLERRWARRVDTVLTVNDAYAGLLAKQFGIAPPPVVLNTPDRYTPPSPPPDLIRDALGLGQDVRVVLYQGGLFSDRGIEQGMEAILQVEHAVFVLMGVGNVTPEISRLAAEERMRGRVSFVDPVPPEDLLDWTASADVMLMAIQPTTVNHRFTTPQKLWEAIAAGVPVVATDLPGMAAVVRETGCGVLVDATDPTEIARGIRAIIDAPAEERRAMRERTWRAGQDRYNWEHETETLLRLYRELLGQREPARPSPASASTSET